MQLFVFRDVKECFVLTVNPEIKGGMNGATARDIYRGFSPGFSL